MRKMKCIGRKRAFDGSVASYTLVEIGEIEGLREEFTEEYLIGAIKRREIGILNLQLNETGTGLIERVKTKPVAIEKQEEIKPKSKPRKTRKTTKKKSSGRKKTKRSKR